MENINTKTNKPKVIALILAILGFISFLGFYLLPKLGFLQSKPDPFSSALNIQFTPPLCEANTKKPTNIFKDVAVTHPNGQTIYFLREKGVVSGYGENEKVCLNKFKPNQKVTRAEFLKMFYEIKISVEENVDKNTEVEKPFSFNEKTTAAILLANRNAQKKESTRERLERFKQEQKEKTERSFEDVPIDEWHSPYFTAAKEDVIITQGRPADNILRAELVTILGRQLKNHKCIPLKPGVLENINLCKLTNAEYAYMPYKHGVFYNAIPENTLTLPEEPGACIDANYDDEVTRAEMAEFLARMYFVLTQSENLKEQPCIPYDEDKMWELILKDFPLPQMPSDWSGGPPTSFQFQPPPPPIVSPRTNADGLLLDETNVLLSTEDEILGPAITVDPGEYPRNDTVTQGKSAIISFEKLPEDKENPNIGRLGQITLYGSVTNHLYKPEFQTKSGPLDPALAIIHGNSELFNSLKTYKPEEFKDGEPASEEIIKVLNKGPYEGAEPIFSNGKNKVSADNIRGIQYELSYENDAGKFQIELKDILGDTKICITNFPFEDYGITFAIRCDSQNFADFQKIIDKVKLDRRQFQQLPSAPPSSQMDFTPAQPPGDSSVQQKMRQFSTQTSSLLQNCGIASIDTKKIGAAYMLDPGSSQIAPTVFLKGQSLVIGFANIPVQQNTVSMMRSSTEGSLTCQTYDFVANPQMFMAANAPEFRLMMGSGALRDALKNESESSFQNNALCPQTIKNTLDGTSSFSKYEISNCVNRIINDKRGIQFNIKYTDLRFSQMLGLPDATLLVTVFPFETKAASFIMKSNSEQLNDFTLAINSVQWIRIKQ